MPDDRTAATGGATTADGRKTGKRLAASLSLLPAAGAVLAALWLSPAAAQSPAVPPAAAPVRPAPAQLRGDLEAILSRPEYRQMHAPWLDALTRRALALLRKLIQWYRDHLGKSFERLHDASPVFYWAIVAVGVTLVLLLLYHIYLTLRSAFGEGGAAGRSRAAKGLPDSRIAPEALLSEADAAAAAGDFHRALQQLYLALIRNLDRAGLLRYDRSATNYEYLRQVRDARSIAEPLAALTTRAEAVWYGRRDFSRVSYDECRGLVLEAWQEGGERAAQ